MLSHEQYVRLQLADGPEAMSMPTIEVPNRGDMAGVVLRVIDGDSLEACALLRIGSIRVLGIDAPEMNTTEGKRAKQFAEAVLPIGRVLLMRLQGPDKYGGRVLGNVQLPDGRWFTEMMLASGHARSYDGGAR